MGVEKMLLKQQLIRENDKKGTIRLRNTYDMSMAADLARMVNESNAGGTMGTKNDGCRVMGFIPPEEWLYNIHLIAAKRAKQQGDMGKYTMYLTRYFRENPQFRVQRKTKYWRGSRAVLLG